MVRATQSPKPVHTVAVCANLASIRMRMTLVLGVMLDLSLLQMVASCARGGPSPNNLVPVGVPPVVLV